MADIKIIYVAYVDPTGGNPSRVLDDLEMKDFSYATLGLAGVFLEETPDCLKLGEVELDGDDQERLNAFPSYRQVIAIPKRCIVKQIDFELKDGKEVKSED